MRALSLLLSVAWSIAAIAQIPAGISTTKQAVSRDGVKAMCDLPPREHLMNRGGNDRTRENPMGEPGKGYGLCVFTSVEVAARWQAARELHGFQEWMTRRPGGGYPEKLDRMIAAFCKERNVPTPAYVQHTGGDEAFLDLVVKTDRLACVTYAGMDGFYKDAWGRDTWIDHMVNLAHLDAQTAAIIDNNRPGVWVWMHRKDFLVRWRARGGGWAVAWLDPPPPPHLPGMSMQNSTGCVSGRCPATSPTQGNQHWLNGRWVPATSGDEWGYWVGNRCVARCFADGRCEAVDARGFATGTPIVPPAPLPVAVSRLQPFATGSAWPNFGIDTARVDQLPTYSICGVAVTREEAHAALAGGSLVDDSDRWHLTAVGDAAFQARFQRDVAVLPATIRSRLHVQSYAPTEWPVSVFALPTGVCLRKPSPSRTAEQVGVVTVADYTPAKLAELLSTITGASPVPNPRPKPPAVPTPEGEPTHEQLLPVSQSPTDVPGAVALVLALALLILSVLRRPAC